MCNHQDALLFSASILHNGVGRSTSRLGALYSILNLSRSQEVDLHPLNVRVARWKVEHLIEGEVLRGPMSFLAFNIRCFIFHIAPLMVEMQIYIY